jgi:hypothetical protein
MSKHDAEYCGQRRRTQGIAEHNPFSAPEFLR